MRSVPRPVIAIVVAVAVIGIAVGLWAFQPWKVFTSSELDEASPIATARPSSTAVPGTGEASATETTAADEASTPQVLAQGKFVSQEHETSGTAQVIEKADGSRVLRVEGLASSDGPDLHVWLSDAKAGLSDWGAYDDGRYVALGALKATHGNHNYPIADDAKLAGLRSVVIWCDRFNVAFGSAKLDL